MAKYLDIVKKVGKFAFPLNALLLLVGKIRNSELRSKFLDKPSENTFSWSFRSGKSN